MTRARVLAAAFVISLLGMTDHSQAAPPSNVLLSRGRTEPSIAADPRNPSTIVVTTNTNYSAPVGGTYPAAYFNSHDGGGSFGAGLAPIVGPYTTQADTTVTVDRQGTVFFSYLGETPAYCSGGRSAVLLAHSTDSGRSFRSPMVVDSDPEDDKPNMAVESIQGARSHVFLTWTRFRSKGSEIWLARSADGGSSFSKPIRLHSSSVFNFGTLPVVGPRGRIYVFWSVFADGPLTASSPTRIVMRASTDDGRHFGPVRNVAGPFPAVPRMALPGYLRNLTMAAAVADERGNLFVAWSRVRARHADGSVDADIMARRSANGGASWSQPVRVNDSTRGDRFMPAMAQLSGNSVGLAFYDRRNNVWELDTFAARVTFHGRLKVSRNVRVNRLAPSIYRIFFIKPGTTCFSPGRFFGDYIGVTRLSNDVLGVSWADTQAKLQDETDIWFARVSLP